MDKVKLKFEMGEPKKVTYKGIEIQVNPLLTLAQQAYIIDQYTKEYFGKKNPAIELSEYDYLQAECALKNYIFQVATNIDIEDLDNDLYIDDELWTDISDSIENYNEFHNSLIIIIKDIKEQKRLDKSIGTVVENLVDKVYSAIEKLENLNGEEIDKAREAGLEMIKQLKDSSILNDVLPKEAA
jgi:hypothetical protein